MHLSVLFWHSLRESFEVFCKQPCFVVESHPVYWLPKFLQSLQENLETVHRNRLNSVFTQSCNSSGESSFSSVLYSLCTLCIFVFSDVTPCSLIETTISAEPTPYSLKMKLVRSLWILVTTYQVKRRHLYGKLKLHTLLAFMGRSNYTHCSPLWEAQTIHIAHLYGKLKLYTLLTFMESSNYTHFSPLWEDQTTHIVHLYGKLKLHTLLTLMESSNYTHCSPLWEAQTTHIVHLYGKLKLHTFLTLMESSNYIHCSP